MAFYPYQLLLKCSTHVYMRTKTFSAPNGRKHGNYYWYLAQSAWAVEYTDCTSAEEYPPNEFPRYDTKQSDGEVPPVLDLWGMRGTLSLPTLPGSLLPGVVASDSALSMG